MTRDTFEFGPYRLESGPDCLWRGSEEIALRPKSLKVLAYLARRPGRLVTKNELREQVWGATHVSDTTLRVAVREIRAALGDDQDRPTYLETVHARGYRFLVANDPAAVLDDDKRSTPDVPGGERSEAIVGRQREVEHLINLLREVSGGERRLIFLGGEPGVGKTTVVDLFMERLVERPQTTCVRGQSMMSYGSGEAYGPVLEALARLGRRASGGAVIRVLERCAPMWLVQLPALVKSEELERLQGQVQGATRERMVRELNDALERLTAKDTLVLVLEDLHWCDVATLDLLVAIAQRPEPARLLIIGTYRPAEAVVHLPELRAMIGELEGQGLCERFELERLTPGDVGAYVSARMEGVGSDDVATVLWERSGGNALFMVNLLEHLMDAGAIRRGDERWVVERASAALTQIPQGLRPFIQSRFNALSGEERELLQVASVVGVEFTAAAVAAGLPSGEERHPERIESRLESLVSHTHLIDPCGTTEWPDGTLTARYRFAHALYREGLYEQIPEARRARLHRHVGERLQAAYGPEDAPLAAVLAVHFENGRDAESAARYRRMAGERALGRHAYHEAAEHLEKALEAFDQAGSRPADGDPEDSVRWELEVCTTLGAVLNVTRGHSDPEVGKVHSRARMLIERLDDPVAELSTLFNLWTFSSSAADLTECANLVTRMSELAAGTENDEVALASHCAGARTALFRGKLAESADSVRQVFALYDPLRHSDLVNRTYNDEAGVSSLGADGWRLWLQGFPAQAAARARAACELAERLDHPFSRAYALNWLIGTLQFRGETVQLGRRVSDVHSISAKHGFSLWSAWATFFAGWVAGARADVGDGADGIALMERGLDAWRGAGTHILEPYLLALLSETCLRAGRIDAAGERLAEARAQVEKSDERWWEAELHRLEGEILLAAADDGAHDEDSADRNHGDRAQACFRTALEVARRQGARSLELRAALSLSRVSSRSRSAEARRVLGGVLETFSEGHDTADLRAAHEQMAQLSRAD